MVNQSVIFFFFLKPLYSQVPRFQSCGTGQRHWFRFTKTDFATMIDLLLNSFPVEVLQSDILTFLTTKDFLLLDTACTNRNLYLKLRSVLWGTNVSQHLGLITPCKAFWVAKRKVMIQNLTFHPSVLDVDIISLCASLKNVIEISFDATSHLRSDRYDKIPNNCKISDRTVQTITKYCPAIVSLNLNGCRRITNRSILALAKHSTQLETLQIERCGRISSSAFEELTKKCTNLRWLNVNNTHTLLTVIAQNCKQLEKLQCRGQCSAATANIQLAAMECSKLRYLDCSYSYITGAVIECITIHCPNLTHLLAFSYSFIPADNFIELTEGCRNLQTLFVTTCSARVMNAIRKNCSQLQELRLGINYDDDEVEDERASDVNEALNALLYDDLTTLITLLRCDR